MFFARRQHRNSTSDEALAVLAGAKDGEALGILFHRYAHLLFGVGLKYLKDGEKSKDTVMELFTDLPDLLVAHDVKRFKPWVHTVMRNRCLQHFRKNGKVHHVELGIYADESDPEEMELRENDLELLEKCINELRDEQRECITLFYMQEQSYQQIADRIGIPVETVRSRLQNGRRNLKLKMTEHADQH